MEGEEVVENMYQIGDKVVPVWSVSTDRQEICAINYVGTKYGTDGHTPIYKCKSPNGVVTADWYYAEQLNPVRKKKYRIEQIVEADSEKEALGLRFAEGGVRAVEVE